MPNLSANLPDASLENTCEVIEELIQGARALLTLLVHEHSALKQKKNSDLFEIAKQKHTRLGALEGRFQQKGDAIEHLRAAVSRHRHGEFMLTRPSTAFVTLWDVLRDTLQRCRQQNSTNGELIAALSCHARGMLSLMQSARAESDVYDGNGRHCSSGLSSYSNTA